MTGHRPDAEQSQEFLSTMHTMIDDLDTISSAINENTYIRLVNGLQRLYTIHNSSIQSPSSVRELINQRYSERYQEILLDNNEVEITRILAEHYGRVYDSSGVLINDTINTINSDANTNINTNTNTNTSTNPIINSALNNYNNYDNWNENNPAQNRDSARISYTSLYSNTSNHWIAVALREGLRSAR
jgi:hypothetical protein